MDAMRGVKIGEGERDGGKRIRENNCFASSQPQHLERQLTKEGSGVGVCGFVKTTFKDLGVDHDRTLEANRVPLR